ncbi:hypothetical protein ACIRU3_29495 [Streptomyces sp. NPDC101151]|uniref:hypothetical protein n=1 Tax=Streptomyces sp. NPDC101151 TaxID=3366115 RepID=UPI0037F40ACE
MLIPSVPTEVVYVNENNVTLTKPVHAWDDQGRALVLLRNRLMRADEMAGFKEVREANPIVGIAPGGGWVITWFDKEEGWESSQPVLAWAIRANGYAEAVDTDPTGDACVVSEVGGDRRFSHPHAEFKSPEGAQGEENAGKE